jgi:hypothetical protein
MISSEMPLVKVLRHLIAAERFKLINIVPFVIFCWQRSESSLATAV